MKTWIKIVTAAVALSTGFFHIETDVGNVYPGQIVLIVLMLTVYFTQYDLIEEIRCQKNSKD